MLIFAKRHLTEFLKGINNMPRGGPRKNAGRKPSPIKKKSYTTRLRPDLIAWLKEQVNASIEIEKALDKHIDKD